MPIALFAAVALAATPDAPQPTIITNPDWLRRPSGSQVAGVYPASAARRRVSGRTVINCAVTTAGLLEACEVVDETPPGEGFGAAALALAPTFQMRPATMAPIGGTPVAFRAHITIPINFVIPGGRAPSAPSAPPAPATGSRLAGSGALPERSIGPVASSTGDITVFTRPVWAAAPSFADVAGAWPRGLAGASGHVVLRCAFNTRTGAPGDCETVSEEPAGKGFAKAARPLTRRFQLKVGPELGGEPTVWAQIAFHFVDPRGADFTARHIGQPTWIAAPDPAQAAALFPAQAAAAGLKSGHGVARCVVAADGALTACQPLDADPAGVGFSEAAVKMAQAMRMNPWTDEGGPVDGATIDLPIRFERPPEAPTATPPPQP